MAAGAWLLRQPALRAAGPARLGLAGGGPDAAAVLVRGSAAGLRETRWLAGAWLLEHLSAFATAWLAQPGVGAAQAATGGAVDWTRVNRALVPARGSATPDATAGTARGRVL